MSKSTATTLIAAIATSALLVACTDDATTAINSLVTGSSQGSSSSTSAQNINNAAVATDITAERDANNISAGLAEDQWSQLATQSVPADGTITATGIYDITGNAGAITVDAADQTVVLRLKDATMSGITVLAAKDVVIVTEGTSTVTGASDQTEDSTINAAIHAEADLTFAGTGTLNVTGSAKGISTSDDIAILGGTINVTAGTDGIRGKDSVAIYGGQVTVTAGQDGIVSNQDTDSAKGVIDIQGGAVTVTAGDDALNAATDVIITGGTVKLTSEGTYVDTTDAEVKSHGINAGTLIAIGGGEVTVDATTDGLNTDGTTLIADGTTTISAGDDGVHSVQALSISGGSVSVTRSEEGVEGLAITFSGGTTTLTSNDDAINATVDTDVITSSATPTVTISGGDQILYAGGDGLDSNGTATVTGGTTVIYGPTSRDNGAMDVDGTFSVDGGTLIAIGQSGMPRTPDSGAQGWIQTNLTATQGSTVSITDASGVELYSVKAEIAGSSVFASVGGMTDGQSYTVTAGDQTATATAGEGGGMGGGMMGGQPPTRGQ